MRIYKLHALFIALTLFLSFTVVAQDIEVFHTSLNILSVTPTPDAKNVNPSDGQIVVMFDRSVVPITELSRPQSLLQFEPPIRGIGEWIHPAIYRFTPGPRALVGGATYTVTLPDSLTAIDGAVLNEATGWSFRTADPQVIEIKPTGVWLDKWSILRDSAFRVAFTQPMDRASTQAAFTVERYVGPYCYDGCSQRPEDWGAIEGYFSWNVENTEMTFTPAELLDYSEAGIGSYRASLTTQALNAAGSAALTQPVDDYFRTVSQPSVTSITPSIDEDISPGRQTIEIHFSGPMNTETYRGRYVINPAPSGEILPTIAEDGTTLRLTFEHTLHELYTVTILPGIEDHYGTEIETEFSSSYFVRNPRPEDISYGFSAPEGQPLAIIGDYLEDPSIPLSVFGEGNLEVVLDVYRTNLDQLLFDAAQAGRNLANAFSYTSTDLYASTGYSPALTYPDIGWARPEQLVSHRVENFSMVKTGELETVYMALQDPDSRPLPLGLYGVQLDKKSNRVLAVTNVSLTLQRSADELMVWVTDYTDARPVAEIMIKVQGLTYTAAARTDANGIVRFPLTAQDGFVFVTTHAADVFGIWFSDSGPSTQSARNYLLTDRAIYRPGEQVHFRGILRDRDDMNYAVPVEPSLQVYVDVAKHVYCEYYMYSCDVDRLYQAQLALSDFGTFSDTIQLPQDIEPGYYYISYSSCPPDQENCTANYSGQRGFSVAEYRVPEFTVQLTPQYDEVISAEPVNIDVSASYYFGGLLSHARFTRNGWGVSAGTFNYQGPEAGYSFGDPLNRGSASVYAPNEHLQLGPDGHYLLTDAPQLTGSYPARFGMSATVIDASGQTISANTSVLMHPSTSYIGLRLQATGSQARENSTWIAISNGEQFVTVNANNLLLGDTARVDVLTVSHESVTKPNVQVYVEVIESRVTRREVSFGEYSMSYENISLGMSPLLTDAEGHAIYEFTPPHASRFHVVFYTFDEQGRRGQSAITFVIPDETFIPEASKSALLSSSGCSVGEPISTLAVLVDKHHYYQLDGKYSPGEKVLVSFRNPYRMPATALITIVRGGISHTEVVAVGLSEFVYEVELTAEDAPYIVVHVALLRPAVRESTLPVYISGQTNIPVDNPSWRLNLDITQSTDIAAAGERVTFDIEVTDDLGQPVRAEIGMSLTDEAVSDLVRYYVPSLEDFFFAQASRDGTFATSSNRALVRTAHFGLGSYCGRGGGGVSEGYDPRERDDFVTTPLWEPHVITDDNGRASVSVTMPDNMTQWLFKAQALTVDTRVGDGDATLVTTLPIIVRAIAPRFLVVGDHLPLAAIVHNDTNEPLRVTVTLDARGVTLDNGNPTQILTLPPFGLQRVEWWVKVEAVEGVHMAVSAVSDNGLQDASIPTLTTGENNTIPVYAFTVTETLATSGILTEIGEVTERIDLRQMTTAQDVSLTVSMQAQLSSTMLERIQALKLSSEPSMFELADYIRIAVAGLNAVDNLPDDDRDLLRNQIQASVERLGQLRNVGWAWGWYESMGNDPYATARVLIALADARTVGITLNSSAFEDAVRYLSNFVSMPRVNTPSDELNTQAQILYTLSKYDGITLDSLNALYEYRLEMSIAARALLLSAYLEVAPDAEAVKSLISDLNGAAIISATGTHWEEADDFRPYGMDGSKTTAMVLSALLKADPAYPLAPNTVRWLMTAHSNRSLWIGEETAWVTVALGAWAQAIDESQPSYSFSVSLNDEQISEGAFLTDEVDTQIYRASFSMDDFALDQPNDVTIQRWEGSGALYYTARLHTTYPADAAEEISRGVRIEREYVRDTDGAPLDTVTAGDLVIVRLTLYVSQDFQYFLLQDILPAGLEPIDPSLLINTQQSQPPLLKSLNRQNPYWNWGYQYWGRTKIYDDGIVLQARYLPRGVYSYAYQARAISPGEFSIPPAVGMAELQPEVFGRTEAGYLIIQPQ